MKLRPLLAILFFTLFFLNSNAQEFKLGKVSITELQEKMHPKDTAAVAAILFKKGDVSFEYSIDAGFTVITEVAMRIKIYKKEGYDWANQEVQYRIGNSSKENVEFSDAVTYNLVNGKIEKTKLKSEGEFDEKVNRYWNKRKITMPNVKEGSVIEFKYTIKSPNIGLLSEWSFQTNIPVNFVKYKTHIPEYFVYNTLFKGDIVPKIIVEKNSKSVSIPYSRRKSIFVVVKVERDYSKIPKTTSSEKKIDYMETQTTYTTENLPAMKEEAYVNNIHNYAVSVGHELSMTQLPSEATKIYSTDWETLVKKIYEDDDFGPELNKTDYFEDDLKTVVAGLASPEEKIAAILNYVKATVKWNEYYDYYCHDGVRNAYITKTGNVAEINLMLTAMLRYAGLTANPVLISTRSNGIAMFPNRTAFNYVIAAVETPGGLTLLDATDKFSVPNVLPFRALNWVGRLIRKEGTSEEVDLMPKTTSNNTVMMNYSIDGKGLVSGKIRRQRTDYNAMIFRKNVDNVNEDAYLEKLENENEKAQISDYSRTNAQDLKAPVVEIFSFSGSNLCEFIGEKIYVNPLLFFTDNKNPFKQEKREYPVDYGFPFMDKYAVNIQIPEGYTIEMLPAPAAITMEENLGSFKFMVNYSGNTIQLSLTQQINSPIISAEYYSMLKEYYQGVIAKQNEKIVLKKV